MMWPKLEIDPIGDALAELREFYRLHRKRADLLICSPDKYQQLMSVGYRLFKPVADGWEIDGALIRYDGRVSGFEARIR